MKHLLLLTCLLLLTACQGLTPPSRWRWTPADAGLPRRAMVLAVAAHPTRPNLMWAGYYAPGGLAISTDGGQSWRTDSAGLADNPVFDLLPLEATLWAATRDGVFRSHDNGQSWQPAPAGLPPAATFALAADAAGRVYVGLDGHGVFRQSNDRAGWQPLAVTAPALAAAGVLSIAVAGDGQTLLAGTSGQGVWASTNGGQSWTATYPGHYVANVALNPAQPATGLATLRDRLVRTRDGGHSWHTLPLPWAQTQVTSLLWRPDGALGAGTSRGALYRSLDSGNTWQGGDTGPALGGLLSLALTAPAEGQPARLLAGAWTGLYGSSNGGQSWQALAPTLGSLEARSLLPTAAGLHLGTRQGIFRWQPEAQRWAPLAGQPPSGTLALAVNPLNDSVWYAGTASSGIYRTRDAGTSWQPLPTLLKGVPALAVNPANAAQIYYLAAWERVYESLDGGLSWNARWDGLGDVIETVSLAVDPAAPVAYVGTEFGLYRSPAGAPWELTAEALADQTILTLLPRRRPGFTPRQTELLIGTTRGIFRSLDRGSTVQGSAQGWGRGLENRSVTALAAKPGANRHLLAGTAYQGVFESLDGGASWQAIGPPDLAESVVTALAWQPGGELFVATGESVWRGQPVIP